MIRADRFWRDRATNPRSVDVRDQLGMAGVPIGAGSTDGFARYFTMRNPHNHRAVLELCVQDLALPMWRVAASVTFEARQTVRIEVGHYDDTRLRGRWVDARTEGERIRDLIADARAAAESEG